VNTITAAITVSIGVAYLALMVMAIHDLRSERSALGWGFVAATGTCGPHHLVHGEHLVTGVMTATGPEFGAAVVGLLPAVVFAVLRVQALRGERGDVSIGGTPVLLSAMPVVVASVYGLLFARTLDASASHVDLASLLPSGVEFAMFVVIGWLLWGSQMARRRVEGVWSLSGLALTSIFLTCAFMHLTFGLNRHHDLHLIVLNWFGAAASVLFAVIAFRAARQARRDWDTRPRGQRVLHPKRNAPWALAAD
jgi:hypothetical protein